ncbi:CRISPR-associated helicase/endonuclease Cas3 [Dethiosulfatarculus sandiegensis]|uniref:CRISPR-associated protein Cas3 n=1 Tax=Dethiosulfatarculus sandiegensis TaxID=1429043 RepID=A0A0D2G8A4_9BACT|nr:CRISPR-associated helicase/endonuclease Cas3 [Dethiosulfatarculus sandiegensis]KIX11182.1 CRISPR-associated protein Cas3 [Dethiosulfatarculus sandiegensis]
MPTDFYAHSTESTDKSTWQTLQDHLTGVAGLAAGFAGKFDAAEWGCAAGLQHDQGKGSLAYQKRLQGGPKVDHSTAGAQQAMDLFGPDEGRLLAYAICGHHGGMPDGISAESVSLRERLIKKVQDTKVFRKSLSLDYPQILNLPFQIDPYRSGFELSFFTRMVFSSLVDADFLDTEKFLNPDKGDWRKGAPSLAELKTILDRYLSQLRAKAKENPLNIIRNQILDQCLDAARWDPGLFSLTVPTGGGKTISTLAFGLEHLHKHKMDRIIYVIPYTSIIEQNAEVFRKILGEEAVLEHHSNLGIPDPEQDLDPATTRARLASENWDAPLVVTTNVQFFESLFSNRPGRCRKLHNLAKSVVILDEAQMLPRNLLIPCMEALRELTTHYGASVVLCSATQPTLNDAETFKKAAMRPREIIEQPQSLYKRLRRVKAVNLGKLSDNDLCQRLSREERVLCIVNTRKQAKKLFKKLTALTGEDGCFHLSALMYPEHRKAKLAEIRQALSQGRACRVISTQLVEAGVDLDFPVVYRAIAGIDSMAQAAGRCNREGLLNGLGQLFIFTPECGLPGYSLRAPSEEAGSVLRNFEDPLSLEAVETFFGLLFWREGQSGLLDSKNIIKHLEQGAGDLNFPFRQVAQDFKYIDSPGQAVFVCPEEEKRDQIVTGLCYSKKPGLYARMAQPYTVQVYPWQMLSLEQMGVIRRVGDLQFPVLENQTAYDDDLGLLLDQPDRIDPNDLLQVS